METVKETDTIVFKLKEGVTFGKAQALNKFAAENDLRIDRLDDDGELSIYGSVAPNGDADLKSIADELCRIDEIDGAYIKKPASPP